MTIESFSPLWYLAFMIDVILGSLCFYLITTQMVTYRYAGLCWFMGWWAFADSISLMLNSYMGTDYFFSYHQIGIISDTAINLAMIVFLMRFMNDNWGMTEADWQKIYQVRVDAKIRKLQK